MVLTRRQKKHCPGSFPESYKRPRGNPYNNIFKSDAGKYRTYVPHLLHGQAAEASKHASNQNTQVITFA
jgi:hypothetical protein